MKKVLILQNKILHYRKPFYNKLAEKYDLTVLHSGEPSIESNEIYKELIVPVKTILKLKFQKGVISEVRKGNYYAVVAMMDIHWINNILASFIFPSKTKFIWWGIMISDNDFGNKVRALILKQGLPSIFYTKQGIKDMEKYGVKSDKSTFCNNTIEIENRIKSFKIKGKNSILFVGSLDQRKRLDIIISAFNIIKTKTNKEIHLDIIGSGIEEDNIKLLIKKLDLAKNVTIHGQINNTTVLGSFYENAICSVSFGQAGLAVLQSMAYGVPFVTKKGAISGGEITNISHQVNGFTCEDNVESLGEHMLLLCNNEDLSLKMGENAFKHYSNFCTFGNMTTKFSNCIES